MSEIRTHEQVVGIVCTLAAEAHNDCEQEREEYGMQTRQAMQWLEATDAALRAEVERLTAAATEALAVLTEVADAAYYGAGYVVPLGMGARVDAAKARLAGALDARRRG